MFQIAIIGCGVVGSGVADILLEKQEELGKRFNEEVRLTKIVDIKNMTGTPYAPYLTSDQKEVLEDEAIRLLVVTVGGLDQAAEICRKALRAENT